MDKKTLMIDIDDVLALDGFLNAINVFEGTNYTLEDSKDYYLQEILPDKEKFLEYLLSHDLNWYKFGCVNERAIEVLEELSDKYEIFPFSAYVIPELKKESARCLKYKHDFLINNFPFIDPHNYLFGTRKDLFYFDVKIDDKIENLSNASLKLLYTAHHNKHFTDDELHINNVIRVDDFDEVLTILNKRAKSLRK